jgi:hypothetical protein
MEEEQVNFIVDMLEHLEELLDVEDSEDSQSYQDEKFDLNGAQDVMIQLI